MRCATVASASRKALAISVVVNPTTARSVRATRASCDSAGWQHVKISRRRSSASAGSGRKSERSSSTSFSRYRVSRRRMSMARRRAVVINHAPGLSGMPCSGHFSSAATRLSWTTSSARAKSPSTRISAAVSRPASSLKTAATAASVVACVSSAFRVVDQGPDLDDAAAGPCLGLAALDANRRCRARTLELSATGDPARLAVLLEPLVYALVAGGSCGLGHLLPGILLFNAAGKHQDVLHSYLQI